MPDAKQTAFPDIAGSDIDAADTVPIVDISAGANKEATVAGIGTAMGEFMPAPIPTLVERHGGVYVGKRALDKWRYTKQLARTVVVVSDSLGQGDVGGLDPWPERLARDLGNWNGPRLTAGAGYYGFYRSGQLIGAPNGDREWIPWGTWGYVGVAGTSDLAPYTSTLFISDANATALRNVNDCTTVINTFNLTSATMAFVAGDVGAFITGTNIPRDTYIQSVTSATAATMNNCATASTAGTGNLAIHGAVVSWTRPIMANNGCRKMLDGATTNTSTTITCASANFQTIDVGKMITGGGIPANTVISSRSDYQTAVISNAATSTAVGRNFFIHDGRVVNDAVTATNTTLTSATAVFDSADVFSKVIGTDIPAGTYIASVQTPTSCTLSQATTASGSARFLFINTREAGRIVGDMLSSAGTGTIVSASAAFTENDVGRQVMGTSIANNTVISSITNSTTAVLNSTIATTNSLGTLQIGAKQTIAIAAVEILWVDGIASHGASFSRSSDGGITWASIAQTTTGGPKLMRTQVTVAGPNSILIRANVGTSKTSAAKSQTYQCGINVYQVAPVTAGVQAPGMNLYNLSRDGYALENLCHGGVGDSLAFLDNGLGGTFPGLRPDLVIVLFSNDQLVSTEAKWKNNLNRLLDRVQSYADVIFLGTYEMGDGRGLTITQTMNAAMKALIVPTSTLWTVADGVTASSTTITSATLGFMKSDIGRTITGTDIPASTTITAVASATSATISNAATGTGSARTFTIAGRTTDTGNAFIDMYEAYAAQDVTGYTAAAADGLMYDTVHASQIGHNEMGARVSRLARVFS